MSKELWKDITGYEGLYQISNFGNVKSLSDRWGKERLLKPSKNSSGYLNINLSKDNKIKNFTIHKLVAIVFLGHTPNGYKTVVNHIDKNKLNNHVNNLELVTQRYNSSCHKTDVGVCFFKPTNKWVSNIQINGKNNHLGLFTNKEDAIEMYQKALANIHLYDNNAKEFRILLSNLEQIHHTYI